MNQNKIKKLLIIGLLMLIILLFGCQKKQTEECQAINLKDNVIYEETIYIDNTPYVIDIYFDNERTSRVIFFNISNETHTLRIINRKLDINWSNVEKINMSIKHRYVDKQ